MAMELRTKLECSSFFKPGAVFTLLFTLVQDINRLEEKKGKSLLVQCINRLEEKKDKQENERHTGRRLDIADVLSDMLGAPSELGPHDIFVILHFLKYFLARLLFSSFSIFPGTIRPRCTTMPWTIWPALVVLWGVCWMFCDPRSDAPSEHSGTSPSEIENSQQDVYLGWDRHRVQPDLENAQALQWIEAFQTDAPSWYPPSDDLGSLPWTGDQHVPVNPPLSAPWTGTSFEEIIHSADILRATETPQPAKYRAVSNDNSHQVQLAPVPLEARSRDNLAVDFGKDPCTSSAGYFNDSTAQHEAFVNTRNSESSNQFVSTVERSFKCTISDCDALPFRNKEALNEHLKEHDRSFCCDTHGCHLVFPRAYELNRHKQAVHGEGQQFPCPILLCKYSRHGFKGPFGRKDKLRDHIKNVHCDFDLASIPELQQLPRHARKPTGSRKRVEDEAKLPTSRTAPSRKRGRDSSTGSSGSEVQGSSDIELKRLRKMVEELTEDKRQVAEKHERELEDLKEEKRKLWKMVEDLMRRDQE